MSSIRHHRCEGETSSQLPIRLRREIRLAKVLYNASKYENIHRLLGGRYVKLHCRPCELDAMLFVRRNTSIPVPRVLEVYHCNNNVLHLVIEAVRGDNLFKAWPKMCTAKRKKVVAQLGRYIDELRSLQPTCSGMVGSTKLGPAFDHGFGQFYFGPFESVSEFHRFVRVGESIDKWPVVAEVHRKHCEVKYTHGDLAPHNIMVHNGSITAVLDWETAGWYPEYWEYVRMYSQWHPRWRTLYDHIDQAVVCYKKELEADMAIRIDYKDYASTFDRLASDTLYFKKKRLEGKSERDLYHDTNVPLALKDMFSKSLIKKQ